MKKYLLMICILLLSVSTYAQHKNRTDLWVYKDQPGLRLEGSGAYINFNAGDLTLTQSANTLTLAGGNLSLGTNSLLLTGSIGATGSRLTKGWFTNLEITNLPTVNGVSLSALYTSGDITLGANNITMTGSIAATGNRVTKGWFTDIESRNTPTVGGTSILTNTLFTGNIGIATSSSALHKLSVVAARSTNLNAFNFTMSDVNKTRTTAATARDSSSLNLWFTYTGSPLLTMMDKNGGVLFRADSIGLGVGTATPLTKLSVLTNTTTNLNAFNFVHSGVNKNRSTFAQASDSASFNLAFSYTGSPALNLNNKAGVSIVKADSSAVTMGVPAVMYVGDTTVTKKYGAIVFKTSDSTLYLCKYIRPTGKKCWFKLDN